MNTMKPSTTLICAGIVLLFLAMLYSIAPALVLFLHRNVGVIHAPNNMFLQPGIFAWNYWFCQILGIVLVLMGVLKLRHEKS